MGNHKYFKCIKSFTVDRVDDDGMFLDDEPPVTIPKGSIWEVHFDQYGEPKWISYQIDGYGRLMEMRKEHWEDTEYFLELEGLEQ